MVWLLHIFPKTAFKPIRKTRSFKRFSSYQIEVLLEHFKNNCYIKYEEAKKLAESLNTKEEKIFTWFRQRREMCKTDEGRKFSY